MTTPDYSRQISFFGEDGQQKLSSLKVAIVGIGGLGTHVLQQLAYLGVKHFTLIDHELVEETNLNRYVGAKFSDVGEQKVEVATRIILDINPDATISKIAEPLQTKQAIDSLIESDCIFGCLDNDGARLILNELCRAYMKPYFDMATEIYPEGTDTYGGRVTSVLDGNGCLVCHGRLDLNEASEDLQGDEEKEDKKDIYGIEKNKLGGTGPSVVSINGIIASLGVTEFLAWATELREPNKILFYKGKRGIVTKSTDEPSPDCYYCSGMRGKGEEIDMYRYV